MKKNYLNDICLSCGNVVPCITVSRVLKQGTCDCGESNIFRRDKCSGCNAIIYQQLDDGLTAVEEIYCPNCVDKMIIAKIKHLGAKYKNHMSSSGCIHAIDDKDKEGVRTLCNHVDYHRGYFDSNYHHWDSTDKPVTCKRCLRLLLKDIREKETWEVKST